MKSTISNIFLPVFQVPHVSVHLLQLMVQDRIALEQLMLVLTFTTIATVVTIEKEVAIEHVYLLAIGL